MPNKFFIAGLFSIFFCWFVSAQEKNKKKNELPKEIVTDSVIVKKRNSYNALAPAKAAFYSAVLPGLGQAYNKKYWKIPIVYGGLATGIYFYTTNNKEYNRYRDAYKSRLAGLTTDEFYTVNSSGILVERVTTDGLERGQEFYRKNKEISLLVTLGIYALNIIDANVDAHLMQYNVDENLSLAPHFKINEIDRTSNLGLTLNFKF